IKRYPALTSGVSCRDNACEFYTQADVRRIVRFAKSRNITVVPEIEMPAHATAALRAYPQLGCGSAGVICPRESAVAFLENVLVEVMRLFPSRYIHVGGDEAPVSTERYLMPRIEAFLHAHGRAMVGWDDILGSGVSRKAVIMAWNGERRAIAAISAGHDVVMVPDGPLYFDAYQGARSQEPPATQHMATLEEVYSYDPTPDGLSGEQRSHILGAEAALWTEKIASPNRLFAMALPRAIALSEIAWTPPAQKSWRSFLSRLPAQLAWLRANGYSFRTPSPMIDVIGRRMRFQSMPGNVSGAIALTDQSAATVRLNEPLKGVEIRYTLDGTAPTARSALYGSPLNLRLDRGSQTVTAAAFDARGEVSESSSVVVKRLAPSAFKRTNGSRAWGSIVSP
ncbi:MAG: family 20 glycosylhydrolase, partial [Candidatus Eremiobacteraeota bacterium]|nr:family 20 glycosylhydrolase [Candidatus Eremiobacteraeota bacterium]